MTSSPSTSTGTQTPSWCFISYRHAAIKDLEKLSNGEEQGTKKGSAGFQPSSSTPALTPKIRAISETGPSKL